jgi:hypothetical protein
VDMMHNICACLRARTCAMQNTGAHDAQHRRTPANTSAHLRARPPPPRAGVLHRGHVHRRGALRRHHRRAAGALLRQRRAPCTCVDYFSCDPILTLLFISFFRPCAFPAKLVFLLIYCCAAHSPACHRHHTGESYRKRIMSLWIADEGGSRAICDHQRAGRAE